MSINVRYIVNSVDEAISFYTQTLGFQVDFHPALGFAALSRENMKLYLNSPGIGGAGQSMPDGTTPSPGGWNRIQVEVKNLADMIEKLKEKNASFRNELVQGQGGKQILLEDPSGNLIELFEPQST